MDQVLQQWIINSGIQDEYAPYLAYGILAIVMALLCFLSWYIAKKVVIRFLLQSTKSQRFRTGRIMLENKVFQRLAHIVPAIILKLFAPWIPPMKDFIDKGAGVYTTFVVMMVLDSLLDSVDALYRTREISKVRPIKGFLQVAKIVVYILGGVVIVANLMDEKPLVLLSGIGAMTAVFSLVFKDSIMGLVAGVQLSANDMVRIGDWIEMQKYEADGSVIDISLNTVKIRNFDNSVTTIPAYALISDSFKNWRGMEISGGRRIMRSVNIDMNSICFCSDELLDKLKKTECLKKYIETKQQEIEEYNRCHHFSEDAISARRLTNIGIFRIYLQCYLKSHSGIHAGMAQVVRQLPPNEHGLPIQIYVFASRIDWVSYETIQADVFDHILSVIGLFDLRVFQEPTGHDFRQNGNVNEAGKHE